MHVIPQQYEVAPIDSIEPHPRNVNEGDVGAISESVDTNGWYGAVLVQQSSRRIIAGKHRWIAARNAGAAELPIIVLDVDDEAALRIMLADNRTARLGRDDPTALSRLLAELAEADSGLGLAGTGFDDDDLDALLDELARADVPGAGDGSGESGRGGDVDDRTAFVEFRFGDIAGLATRATYDRFRSRYEAERGEDEAAITLDDVLARWLA